MESRRWHRYLLGVLAAILFLIPSGVQAQQDETTAEDPYRKAIDVAVREFRLGDWQEARAMFMRAHEIKPSARTWRGLGITAYELRHYVEAIEDLEHALDDPRRPLPPELTEQVRDLLTQAKAFTAVYRVRGVPSDAEVRLDGARVHLPEDGNLRLDPGPHTLSVRAPGKGSEERRLEANAGTEKEIQIRLTSEAEGGAASTTANGEEASGLSRRYRVGVALTGVALAFGGAAVGLGVGARNKNSAFEECVDPARCDSLRDQGQRMQLLTNVSAGLSAATAIGAVVVFSLRSRDARDGSTAWFGPTSVHYRLLF